MPELKICGVTNATFAHEAARRGVDYIGLIFAKDSSRQITLADAKEIVSRLRPTGENVCAEVSRCRPRLVGVFVEQSVGEILPVAASLSLDVIQLHRRASAREVDDLRAAGFEVWSLAGGAIGDGLLFDSSHGDGERAFRPGPYKAILAGGISVVNLPEAVATGADVIDVNSSLETSPGVKSVQKLDCLMEKIRRLCGPA